jgi:hypothetical protein
MKFQKMKFHLQKILAELISLTSNYMVTEPHDHYAMKFRDL